MPTHDRDCLAGKDDRLSQHKGYGIDNLLQPRRSGYDVPPVGKGFPTPVEIKMNGISGIDTAKKIRETNEEVKIIFLTA